MDYLKLFLEHNPRHHTTIHLFGKKYDACSRCLGTWTGGIISFIIFGILYLFDFRMEFWPVFLLSWSMAFICFIDWVTSKTSIWNGSNKTRILSGVFLGTGISMWFWFLPVDWFTRLWSLIIIEAIFGMIVFMVNYHEMKNGLYDLYQDFYNKRYSKIFCCDCCGTTCCLGQIFCYGALIMCCCVCPILLCLMLKKG